MDDHANWELDSGLQSMRDDSSPSSSTPLKQPIAVFSDGFSSSSTPLKQPVSVGDGQILKENVAHLGAVPRTDSQKSMMKQSKVDETMSIEFSFHVGSSEASSVPGKAFSAEDESLPQPTTDALFICSYCNRHCKSRAGLCNHEKACIETDTR